MRFAKAGGVTARLSPPGGSREDDGQTTVAFTVKGPSPQEGRPVAFSRSPYQLSTPPALELVTPRRPSIAVEQTASRSSSTTA